MSLDLHSSSLHLPKDVLPQIQKSTQILINVERLSGRAKGLKSSGKKKTHKKNKNHYVVSTLCEVLRETTKWVRLGMSSGPYDRMGRQIRFEYNIMT